MSKHKPRSNSFQRWVRRWTERHPLTNFIVNLDDPDFQDFLQAATEYTGIPANGVDDATTKLACAVYHLAMDYNEQHATAANPSTYRTAH